MKNFLCKKKSVKSIKVLTTSIVLLLVMITMNGCVLKFLVTERNKIGAEIAEKELEKKAEVSRDKCASVANSFYDKYIMALNDNEENVEEIIKNIKREYMTENLIIEMDYRSKKNGEDAIIACKDATNLLQVKQLILGRKNDTAIISFENKNDDGSILVKELELHFRNESGKVLIDGIDTTIKKIDKNGKESKKEQKTKYAIKKDLSEKDKKELEKMKKYCDENK